MLLGQRVRRGGLDSSRGNRRDNHTYIPQQGPCEHTRCTSDLRPRVCVTYFPLLLRSRCGLWVVMALQLRENHRRGGERIDEALLEVA